MTTPALMRLRQAHPQAHVTLLTPAKLAELWRGHPAIDAVLSIEPEEGLLGIARRIREGNYGIGIVFPNSTRSALELFVGRVPKRVGFARPWRTWALTDRVPCSHRKITTRKRSIAEIRRLTRDEPTKPRQTYLASAHHVTDYLKIVQALGANPEPTAPIIPLSDEEVAAVRLRFDAPVQQPLFGLNPGAEYGPAKRWPEERFVEVAQSIAKQINCRWWVFGALGDVAVAERILSKLPKGAAHSLAGKTSLRELCACLKACDVVLTNDTGPMHLAAAVGTPVVVPFGSTSPELTGPGWPVGRGHELIPGQAPCAPCFRRECPVDFRCMRSISADTVVEAVLRIYKRRHE